MSISTNQLDARKDKPGPTSPRTMVKYCTHCGKANDDQAVYCIGCGQKFADQSATPFGQQAAPSPVAQAPAPSILTAELGPGAHEHVLTDIYLRDPAANLLLVARKKSLLHAEYTLVDGSENVVGFIEQKTHLTHRTVSFEDAGHNVQVSVQVSNVERTELRRAACSKTPAGTGWVLSYSPPV